MNFKKDFENAEKCYACEKEFSSEEEKMRDHCHYTGKYRGAACESCNSKMKNPKFIPVIIHNYLSNILECQKMK